MDVVNATTGLLSSAGQRSAADHLLERTWVFYREPEDCTGPAYARYLYNYGETLMRAARFLNPHDREVDFLSWKDAADHDPRQFFHRAVEFGAGDAALARSILCDFLAGTTVSSLVPRTTAILERITKHMGADTMSLTLIDAVSSLAEVLELCALGQGATTMLEHAHRSAAIVGDEFRRAEAAWRLARNLSFGVSANPSSETRILELAQECTDIATRLDIRESDAGSGLARSIAALASSDWTIAADAAREAEDAFGAIPDLLGVAFAKRERVRALIGQRLAGGSMHGSDFDELSEWLQRFAAENAPGLRPIVKLELAMLAAYFDDKLMAELASDAASDAALQEHPYVGTKARELLQSSEGNRAV
jgi:hypothetical protein